MRRFLICGGVDHKPKTLGWLGSAVARRRPDGILFAGGVLDGHRGSATRSSMKFGPEEGRFIERFFETLGQLNIFTAVIPGPADGPLEDFLRIGMHAETEYPGIHLAHATLIEKRDIAVCGIGSALAEGPMVDLDRFSRTMAEYHLRSLRAATQPHKILLLGVPPTGALGGDQGNPLAADLIDSYHPALCVALGPSEHRGTQRIGSSLVINPGLLADGWAAWLDWNCPVNEQVEFLNLRQLMHPVPASDVGDGD